MNYLDDQPAPISECPVLYNVAMTEEIELERLSFSFLHLSIISLKDCY